MKYSIIISLLITISLLGQNPDRKIHPFSKAFVFFLDGGLTISKTDYPNPETGGRLIGGIEYYFPTTTNHIFGIRGFGGGEQINNEENNKIISLPGIGPDTLPNLIETDIYIAGLALIYSYSINDKFFPFVSGGISNLWFSPKLENGKRAPRNNSDEYKRSSIAYDIELGIKYSITQNFSLKINGGFHFLNTDNIDDISTGQNKDFYATSTLGISYSLTSNTDSDEDGILNDVDQCPEEPEDFDGFKDDDGCPENDNDEDGIADLLDQCPDTPEDIDSFQDTDGCPDVDNDGDKIKDELDECPNEAEDVDSFEDENGCPDPDNDGDGILDDEDKCPDVPGSNLNNGCPASDSSQSEYIGAPKEIIIEGEATFYSGKADILPEATNELDRIVKILQIYPEINWRIEGHTDKQETDNLMVRPLSLRRAETILNYFVSKGLPSFQFRIYDMGDRFPISNNNTEYGRMKNRRIVIVREK